jgi:2,4-dienoyl-CoA reductase (NADPH2)
VGGKLGKTTGWIHRLQLKNKNVITHKGVEYQYFKEGLLTFNEAESQHQIPFDSIIVCAGQTSFAPLAEILTNHGKTIQQIGGALNAKKLDAQRAIREGLEAAYSISEWT